MSKSSKVLADPRIYPGLAPLLFAAPMPFVMMAWGEPWIRVVAAYVLTVLFVTMYGSWVRRHMASERKGVR